MSDDSGFGATRIYYNNFAAHLLNAYNPNMLYPQLPYRWRDEDWFRTVDMIADFGYNAMQFWLVPRLFCREGLTSEYGRNFIRQMNAVIEYGRGKGVPVMALCSLATVGSDWMTLCPNIKEQWSELEFLWDAWTKALPGLGGVEIFPGDPGACSLNGCTPETYIDRAVDVAAIVRGNLPDGRFWFNTWGPPFFGWGNLRGPEGWKGEFVQEYQHTAWTFNEERAERSMTHLLKRLPDFPADTAIGINLGFNADGNPEGAQDARPWAREIAKTNPIHTWDFSLTEGENAVVPHYRAQRLFERRREERASAPYSGGICFTMTPMLNQLSLYQAAQSFLRPDEDHMTVAGEFCEKIFGSAGRELLPYLHLFEVFNDWGCYVEINLSREQYHRRMTEFAALLRSLHPVEDAPLHPSPEAYRRELLFFAELFADLSAGSPDYDGLRQDYWRRVYAIYDDLSDHVDPRPKNATDNLIKRFREWGADTSDETTAGKWT